ncbi:mechanosensitive ion channel family protein [Xanthobacter sp. TB0139]|uniref:mechanosensitive ion channel family protein n=1 Tax=Xanthobacter sp. TB0139 TaxID=3459178 RepID=UPI004039932D
MVSNLVHALSTTRPPLLFRVLACTVVLLVLACLAPARARAEGPNWSGIWDTRWPGGATRLTLKQEGDKVRGSYSFYGGHIEGQVKEDRLIGTWTEARASGKFELIMGPEGDSFMGRIGTRRWCTGARVDPDNADQSLHVVQATPQDTLRTFLIGGSAIQNGRLEFQDDIMHLLLFPEGDRSKTNQMEETNQFWLLLNLFSITPAELRPRQTSGDSAAITMERHDGLTYEVRFLKRDGRWYIDMPSEEQVDAALENVLEQHGGRLPSQDRAFRLETPRSTMQAFLSSVRAGHGGLERAIETLNLSELSPVVRQREAALLAEYLNEVIARIGEVVLQEIPNDPGEDAQYVHFSHPDGDIVIAPVEAENGVQWKFTPETLRSIRALYAATEHLPPGARILPYTAASTAPFFRIRAELAEWMPSALYRVGLLELWQWVALMIVGLVGVVGARLAVMLATSARFLSRSDQASESTPFFLTWGIRLFTFGLVIFMGFQLLGLPEQFAEVVKAISVVAMIMGAIPLQFWIVDGIRTAADRSGLISHHGEILANLLAGIAKIILIVGSFLMLAEALNVPYGAALAGLGIGGFAVALAARSTLENVISGFILFADRPLAVGDFCQFGDRLGTVERIGIRSTSVRTLQRTLVAIPNAEFVNMHLENYGRRDRMLLHKSVPLRSSTTPDQMRYVLAETRRLLLAHPRVINEEMRVRFSGFANHAFELEIFTYVDSTDWAEFLGIREDIFLRLMEVVSQAGTDFALPSRTLFLGRDAGMDGRQVAEAEETVQKWRDEERLPFPDFSAEDRAQVSNTLAFPPEGAPRSSTQEAAAPHSGRTRRTFWGLARRGPAPQAMK